MAKFCTKCGKPLEEGRSCNCAVEDSRAVESTKRVVSKVIQSNFMDEVKKVFNSLINFFKSPEDVVKENPVSKAWIITMIIQSIVLFFAVRLGIGLIINIINIVINGGLNLADLDFGVSISPDDIPTDVYFKLFISCIVICLAFLFIFASLIYLLGTKILKSKCVYMNIVNKFSYLSLIVTATILGAIIGFYIHTTVGVIILNFGLIYFIVTTLIFIKEYFKMNINQALLYSTLTILLTSIIGGIATNQVIKILVDSLMKF